MQKLYPEVPLTDLKRILNYGWKSLYLHISRGANVIIDDCTFWSFVGEIALDTARQLRSYVNTLTIKIRLCTSRKNIPWDGYYYFALSEEEYQDYKSQINALGRPKITFTFKDVIAYKLLDECILK